jgi:hypothetical protein
VRAFGTDRLRAGKPEQWILFARRPKGWLPRAPKTLTRAEFPGTAVLWDERFFEVVTADPVPGGGVRYVLEPWREHHIIRVSEAYDEVSEQQREIDYRTSITRNKQRKVANLAGVFTGLLPAVVQEQLASELGILPTKLTALSLLVPFAYIVWCSQAMVRGLFDRSSTPLPLSLLAMYLLLESGIRLNIAWLHRRPIGSILGFFPYLLFYVVVGKRRGAVSPFHVPRGQKLLFTEPTEDVALRDAYSMREPLLSLLTPQEQEALRQRFGYDYRKSAFIVAGAILACCAAGVVTALASMQYGARFGALLSLASAAIVGAEQVLRLSALRRGPAGSMLAVVVRPLTRILLR